VSRPWTELPDLAGQALGGSVMAASDEFFADKENLIRPEPPTFTPRTFTAKGQRYDGWETRRRRGPSDRDWTGPDWALVRLGAPGVIRGVVVDTAHFLGNSPERCAVWATGLEGYPDAAAVAVADWVELVPSTPLRGGTQQRLTVTAERRFTHLRLDIEPDGGVARLRAHGEVVPDPRDWTDLPVDLAAMANGGTMLAASDGFYSPPSNMLQPGRSRFMGDGWETARRRGGGNDWAVLRLAGPATPLVVELDTTHYRGNAPDRAALSGLDARGPDAVLDDRAAWFPLLPPTALLPDTTHRFRLVERRPATHLRLDIYPDGGVGRLRIFGPLTPDGRHALALRWYNLLPPGQAAEVLAAAGLPPDEVARQVAARPATGLPPALAPR